MFVLGCHRSGTSLLARVLSDVLPLLGGSDVLTCRPDDPSAGSEWLPAQIDNPGGFQESQRLVAFNEALLASIGCAWHRPPLHPIPWHDADLFPLLFAARQPFATQALARVWVDKDPRLCITYPAFRHIFLRRIPIVAIIRHPYAVAASLQARDGFCVSHALMIWFLYNQHMVRSLQDSADLCVDYTTLLDQQGSASDALISFLRTFADVELGLGSDATVPLVQQLQAAVRPDWRRNADVLPMALVPQLDAQQLADLCLDLYGDIVRSGCEIATLRRLFASTPECVLSAYAVHGWQPVQPVAEPQASGRPSSRLKRAWQRLTVRP